MEIPEDEVYDKVRHLLRDKKLYMDFSSSETESISSDNSTASATLPTVVTDDDSSEVDTFVNMMDDSMASPICVQEVYDRFVNSGGLEVTEALQQFDTIQVSFDEEGSYLDNESFPWWEGVHGSWKHDEIEKRALTTDMRRRILFVVCLHNFDGSKYSKTEEKLI